MNLTDPARYSPYVEIAIWRHEVRRAGWPVLVTPVVVEVGVLVMAGVAPGSAGHDPVGRLLVAGVEAALPLAAGIGAAALVGGGRPGGAGVEAALPLAAGIGAAALVGRDTAVELQLSLPVAYRSTVLRRLAVTVAWPGLLAMAGTAVLLAGGWWPSAHPGASSVLVWAAPLLWLPAFGGFLAVLLRSSTAASGLVAGVWVVELLFAGLFAGSPLLRVLYLFPTTRLPGLAGWPANRAVLLATASVLLSGLCLLLARPHRLLSEEGE